MISQDDPVAKARNALVRDLEEVEGASAYVVSAWMAMRADNCFEEGYDEEDTATQVWEYLLEDAAVLAPDDAHPTVNRCIVLAQAYGMQRWPERGLEDYFVERSAAAEEEDEEKRRTLEDEARFRALSLWDKALADYEEQHAKVRRRCGMLHLSSH